MRSIVLLVVSLFLVCQVHAQWSWSYPLPQGNKILCVGMVSPGHGFAMGSHGTILTSWDNGESWRLVPTSGGYELNAFHFPTASTGYAIGRDLRDEQNPLEVVMNTTDAGEHWQTASNDHTAPLSSLFFIGETTGFTVGENGIVRKTTDGGATWSNFCLDATVDLADIAFFNANTGILTGESGTLFRTTNGGTTWARITGLPAVNLGKIRIYGEASAFLTISDYVNIGGANKKRVYQLLTSDAGLTWTSRPDSLGLILPYGPDFIDFPTVDTGFVQIYNLFLRTSNGGASWDTIESAGFQHPVRFINGTTGFRYYPANGADQSGILKSIDGGTTWHLVAGGASMPNIYHIVFPIAKIGYALGGFPSSYRGDVLKTTDGGAHWMRPAIDPFNDDCFTTAFFINASLGYAACRNGHIYRTANGGSTWILSSSSDVSTCVSSIWFTDVKHGWYTVPGSGTATYSARLYSTSDAGYHWSMKVMSDLNDMRSLLFTTVDTGYFLASDVVTRQMVIMRTTDKGGTWSRTSSPATDDDLFKLQFFNSRKGYAIGQKMIFRTSDGGESWTGNPISGSWNSFTDVCFLSADTGYITGTRGLILRTQDGGYSWECQESGTGIDLTGIAFPSRDRVFVSGLYGTILTGTNESITNFASPKTVDRGMNIECYPNPAGKTTSLEFTLKRPGNALIRMFDLRGTMITEQQYPGLAPGRNTVSIDLSRLAKGLYAVLITSGMEFGTTRLIISGVE